MIRLFDEVKHKKHIIFDYNGTILNDIDLSLTALNQLLDHHELPAVTEPHYKEHLQFPIKSFYQKMGFDFNLIPFEKISQHYMSLYHDNLHQVEVYHGLRELLTSLHQVKIKTSILTALNQEILLHQLEIFSLSPFFELAFGLPDHNAHSKIQRGKELMLASGFKPEETLLIGDTDHDFEVAESLGCEAILLADGHQAEHRLRKTKAKIINLNRQKTNITVLSK